MLVGLGIAAVVVVAMFVGASQLDRYAWWLLSLEAEEKRRKLARELAELEREVAILQAKCDARGLRP